MKKKAIICFLFFFSILILNPINANAKTVIKECTYNDSKTQVMIEIYEDYTALAIVDKLNGVAQESEKEIPNWNQMRKYVMESNNATCPKYISTSSDQNIYVSNNKTAAQSLGIASSVVNLSKENLANNDNETEIFQCQYTYKSSTANVNFTYHIFSSDVLGYAFSDKEDLAKDGHLWYHGADFKKVFLKAAKTEDGNYTCPTLSIEKTETSITVFPKERYQEECAGECQSLKASKITLSEEAKKNSLSSKKIVSSCVGSAIGAYNSRRYFFPYFRIYSDGSREWSIDGKNYGSVNTSWKVNVGNEHTAKISINDSLISKIYQDKKVVCPEEIYRCVTETGNKKYNYELSVSSGVCSKNELGAADGQAFGSTSYGGSLGDPEDTTTEEGITQEDMQEWLEGYDGDVECNSLLGDVNNPDSVAWLLQKMLNYIKLLGPLLVLVLSSVDFAKSIIVSDEESMKKAQKRLGIRLVLAIALFFLPDLVNTLLTIFGITTDQTCGLN